IICGGKNFRAAYDLSLIDNSWPQDAFDIVNGNTSHSWQKLDAGGHLSHSFELEAKRKGMFHGAPAVIYFRIPTKSVQQEAYSTPIFPLDILEERPPEKKFESHKLLTDFRINMNLRFMQRLMAKYGSQISVISIVVLFIYLIITPSKASKKKR
ncbi:hypothetical protein Gorai_000047, partial [Gossypium raimondii]|nr:hypothetical protein [Gossypium raimondii]